MSKEKTYKAARLHEMAVNARCRGLPSKLAELAALCVALGAGIWSTQYGGLVIGSVIGMFILYSVILQIVSRVVFLLISLITLRAYRMRENFAGESAGDEEWDAWNGKDYGGQAYDDHKFQSETGREGSKTQSNYSDARHEYSGAGADTGSSAGQEESWGGRCRERTMSVDEAKALLGLKGVFSTEELKRAWKAGLKKCHPDQHASEQSEAYEERAKRLNMAYEVLKNLASDLA